MNKIRVSYHTAISDVKFETFVVFFLKLAMSLI